MGEAPGNVHELATDFGMSELEGDARIGKRRVKEETPQVELRNRDAIENM